MENKEQVTFDSIIQAAMLDAALENKISQFKCTVETPVEGVRWVRLVVLPEKMSLEFPKPVTN